VLALYAVSGVRLSRHSAAVLRLVAERAAGRKCRSIAARGAWQQQQRRRANAASATLTAGIYAVNK